MAISKNINLNNGLEINDAYLRICLLSGNKDNININLCSYLSQEAFQQGKEWLEIKEYNFVPITTDTSSNFIKQGYDYLKTLDEYKDSVDC